MKESPREFCGMNGWTGDSSTGYCGLAEVSCKKRWENTRHLQLDSNCEVNGPKKLNRKRQCVAHKKRSAADL